MFIAMLLAALGDAWAFDHQHAAFDAILRARVSFSGVDYAGLKADAGGLDGYLQALAGAEGPGATDAERMAFWINAYNALTLDLIIDNYPLASIRDLDGGDPWSVRTWTVAGQTVTLNQIEHEILRPMGDPRIHAAINCASKGCPPLGGSAFTAEGLDVQLEQASRRWVDVNALTADTGAGTVALSAIFDWFGDDFVPNYGGVHDVPGLDGKQEAAINFISGYVDGPIGDWLKGGGYAASFAEYDWSLNAQ